MSLIPKKGAVYVVDDDEAVRDSLQWLLEGKDYRVRCFDSAESFLARFDPREVACLIADIRMDGMSGLELQDKLLERKSPLPIVFITGHGDVPMAVNTMNLKNLLCQIHAYAFKFHAGSPSGIVCFVTYSLAQ